MIIIFIRGFLSGVFIFFFVVDTVCMLVCCVGVVGAIYVLYH